MTAYYSTDLAAYYAKRADSYEQIYALPERQADLAVLHERVREVMQGHRVLELACGTGYWTAQLAQSAASIVAIDNNPQMMAFAQARKPAGGNVEYVLDDAFDLQTPGSFSACFAGFFWSHVKRQEQTTFLENLHRKLGKDALLVMLDNVYVEDSSTVIARTDLEGNTYQIRTLPDGGRYEVLKNFPTDSALRKRVATSLKDVRILRLAHYWMLTGRFK